MGIGDEDLVDEILIARRHARAALAAAALGAIGGQRYSLDIAAMGDGDDHVLLLDQGLDVMLELDLLQGGLPRRGELGLYLRQLGAHDQLPTIA